MIPFSFQKGNKVAGCEDAPPVAGPVYSVVCDGLGGAGATKHTVLEGEEKKAVTRTSGYLGSRIVCDCVNKYYAQNIVELLTRIKTQDKAAAVNFFLSTLKDQIIATFSEKMQKWDIEPSRSKTLKDFPTTLASAIYIPYADGVTVLAVWAGDSRVYVFTPQKGLQLLSLDDAKNAESEMNSTSEMTNCISASNSFWLNYALYDFKDSGIVFCCSDGCFDYLQSPLHFEWLLLHTILECMPDITGEGLGNVFAESVRDNMYKTIGDDTTMAGVIVGMNSSRQMKSFYRSRMTESGKLAVNLNEQLKELKKVQTERDAAQKTCRLFEEKVLSSICAEVCIALKPGNVNFKLKSQLMTLPCYIEYDQKEQRIKKEIEEECASEIQKIEEVSYQIENVCRNMLVCDFLKWQRQTDHQGGDSSFWSQLPMFSLKNRGLIRENQAYVTPMRAKQFLLTCIEMYKHPYFREISFLPALSDDEIEKYIQSQVGLLEALVVILDNADLSFNDLWSQAYFSTEYFSIERNQCDQNTQFEVLFERAMNDPRSCQFVSDLSARKIAEYQEQRNGINAIRNRFTKEKQKRLEGVMEEFWLDHKNEILEWIMSETEINLRSLFGHTSVPIDKLISYVQAKKTLAMINQKIEVAQAAVDKIWEFYKVDFRLFSQVIEKGVC